MDHHCQIEPLSRVVEAGEADRREVAVFAVWGMGCRNCAIRIENSLIGTRGVLDAHVDHLAEMGVVVFNPDLVTTNALTRIVSQAGNSTGHEYTAWLISQ